MAIVRQNGYKMVDFVNAVLIRQLGDWSGRLLGKLARVNNVNTVKYSLELLNSFHYHEYGKN